MYLFLFVAWSWGLHGLFSSCGERGLLSGWWCAGFSLRWLLLLRSTGARVRAYRWLWHVALESPPIFFCSFFFPLLPCFCSAVPVSFLPPLTCASFVSFLSWFHLCLLLGIGRPCWLRMSLLQHHLVLVSLSILKILFTYYWSVIALQCFLNFCYIKKWIIYMYIYMSPPFSASLPPFP